MASASGRSLSPFDCSCCSSGGGGSRGRRTDNVLKCCIYCGYPEHTLCCFGCRSSTRIIFIGAGGTLMGFWYFMMLSIIIICAGPEYVKRDPAVTTILILGLLYLPMGLILIYSAQARNPLLLVPWIVCNALLALVDFVLTLLYATRADPPPFCTQLNFQLALAFLELCIKVAWCYCIAVVTQFRHKLIAAREVRRQDVRQGVATY